MKMKKLLAGVLSAAMVATMIPASMAFSGVSAAPEDSLVESYDFTKGETAGWGEYSGRTYEEGDVSQIQQSSAGVTFTEEGTYAYSISNPFKTETDMTGFTVAMDVSVPGTTNEYNGLFGFNEHGAYNFFEVTTNGRTVRQNNADGFYDVVDTEMSYLDLATVRYVVTVSADSIKIYVNGELEKTILHTSAESESTTYRLNSVDIAKNASWFNIGFNCTSGTGETDWQWNNSVMTVSSISFYSTALSDADVASLGAYEIEADITSDLIGAYNFNKSDLSNLVGEDATVVEKYVATGGLQAATADNMTYVSGHDSSGMAASFTGGTTGYGISLGNVGFTGNAQTISMWLKTDTFTNYTSAFFGTTENNAQYINITPQGWDDESLYPQVINNAFETIVGTQKVQDTDWHMFTFTLYSNFLTIYVDGQVAQVYVNPNTLNEGYMTTNVLGNVVNAYLGINIYGDNVYDGAIDDVYLYNRALNAVDVAALYDISADKMEAQIIADSLDLEVIGVQKGYLGDNQANTAVRFVANLNKNAVDEYNNVITNVGWAWEVTSANDPEFTENYRTAQVTTVTSDPSLTRNNGNKYAYTLVGASEGENATFYSAAPYAVINVGGENYTFCYNGRGMSYVSDTSTLVYAPVNFAEKTVDNSL